MQKNINKPKISVVMSVYNSEKFLKDAVESILKQTFSDFEFIIINDCSTDNSLRILQQYAKKDKRITIVNNSENIGAASRNIGIIKAKTKYIAIMDSDDISLPNRLNIQYKFLEAHKEIYLAAGSFYFINQNKKIIDKRIINMDHKEVRKNIIHKNIIHNPTVMFRKEKKQLLYRNKFRTAGDYDLWLRLLSKNKKMVILPKIVLKYRISNSSLTAVSKQLQQNNIKKARFFYIERQKVGKDSYNSFKPKKILTPKNSNKTFLQEKELSLFFKKSEDMKGFRQKLKIYWKKNGILNWKFGIIGYIISFSPFWIRQKTRQVIWGI